MEITPALAGLLDTKSAAKEVQQVKQIFLWKHIVCARNVEGRVRNCQAMGEAAPCAQPLPSKVPTNPA